MKKSIERMLSCVMAMLFVAATVFGNVGTLTAQASEGGGQSEFKGKIVYYLDEEEKKAESSQQSEAITEGSGEGSAEDGTQGGETGESTDNSGNGDVPGQTDSQAIAVTQDYQFYSDWTDEAIKTALEAKESDNSLVIMTLEKLQEKDSRFSKEGQIISGWKLLKENPEESTAEDEPDKIIRKLSDIPAEAFTANPAEGVINLAAVWGYPVDVTFSANDDAGTVKSTRVCIGDKITLPDGTIFEGMEGREFQGWNTAWDGSGGSYAAGDTVDIGSEPVTFYALWNESPTEPTEDTSQTEETKQTEETNQTEFFDPNGQNGINGGGETEDTAPVYTVSFEINGEEWTNWALSATKANGYSVTIPEEYQPELEGFTFGGWRVKDSEDVTVYKVPDTISNIKSNLTLSAVWNYTITFDGDGAEDGVPETKTMEKGQTLLFDDTISTPVKSQYEFDGWLDESGNVYNSGSEFPSKNTVLKAAWTWIPRTYNVTYTAGDTEETVLDRVPVQEGSDYPISDMIPQMDGNVFLGWDDGKGGDLINAPYTIEKVSEDLTLTARWRELEQYNITYDAADAAEGTVPDNGTVQEGSDYSVSNIIPEKDGYRFVGWRNDQISVELILPGTTLSGINGDLTLTAEWDPIPEYDITYVAEGAIASTVPAGEKVREGSAYTVSSAIPEREGYTFNSWSEQTSGQVVHPGDVLNGITSNWTLIAKWDPKPTEAPTEAPTEKPTEAPTEAPTEKPTEAPTEKPTEAPKPTEKPTEAPTEPSTEHVPFVPDPNSSTVTGLSAGAVLTSGQKYPFEVRGAGMDNTVPGKGDVRYVPANWNAGNNSGTWQQAPYTGELELAKGDYSLQVNLKREVYNGSGWSADGTMASISVAFSVKEKETEAQTEKLPETKMVTLSDGQTVISADSMNKLIADNAKQNIIINNGRVTFTFAKGTMKAVEGVTAYDFGTSLNSGTNYDKARQLAGNAFAEFIHFNHDGELPGKATIRFPLDAAHANQTCYYYYYNPEQQGFVLVQETVVGGDGYVEIQQDHCSDYVLTNEKLLKTITGVTQISNPTNVPKTDDPTPIIQWVAILVVALLCIVAVVVIILKRRKK